MEINEAMIDKLASLSRLYFNKEEKEELLSDLQNMLGFVNKINELDTIGVTPLLHITSNINVVREDIPKNDFSSLKALYNAGLKDSQFIKVPKVIKK